MENTTLDHISVRIQLSGDSFESRPLFFCHVRRDNHPAASMLHHRSMLCKRHKVRNDLISSVQALGH